MAISLAEFMFMKKGQWAAGVVGKGRFGLVDFLPKFKNEFEVTVLGLKGGQSWRRFRQENPENTNFPKTRQKPLGPREKLLMGRAGLVLQIFFPASENYF
jgi:hypothetical protein